MWTFHMRAVTPAFMRIRTVTLLYEHCLIYKCKGTIGIICPGFIRVNTAAMASRRSRKPD